MKKILYVAIREFMATAATKGFIIGVLATPLMISVVFIAVKAFKNESPRLVGEVAVVDPTGAVFEGIAEYLTPEAIAQRRDDFHQLARDQAPEELWKMVEMAGEEDETRKALEAILGQVPELNVVRLDDEVDIDAEKEPLHHGRPRDGGRLALVVVHENAVVLSGAEEDGRYGNYDLFVREKLHDRIQDDLRRAMRSAIIGARVRAQGMNREQIEALTQVRWARSTTVTDTGERETNEVLNKLLPMAFMALLLISVMTGGQYLLTTTIEEKSSRVVELLLAAVSPMQLMTGKILGQMAVGFLILLLYAGMGMGILAVFTMLGLLDPLLLFYLLVFFFIAYFVVAAMMAAIGASVNEMREAQTLMTPVMVVIMLPWLLWFFIVESPDSVFAVVTSMLPPINSFVMMLRLSSSIPPPWWQVWLSIAIGFASVYVALWFAAKVFRIGLLMYGKPPNYATLIKWIRMA